MRYTVRKSIICVVGRTWINGICAQEKELTRAEVLDCLDNDREITRESVEIWLTAHTGDFMEITDFNASIEYGEDTIDIPWATEQGEIVWHNCMRPCDEDGYEHED